MHKENRKLVSLVLQTVIEGHQSKSLEEAASGLIGLTWNPSPDLLELAVVGLQTLVRHEFRDMVANRQWQLQQRDACLNVLR